MIGLGAGLAITGAVVNSTLYNGEQIYIVEEIIYGSIFNGLAL